MRSQRLGRDRSKIVLALAVGLLLGVLATNLASPPGVRVIGGTRDGDGFAAEDGVGDTDNIGGGEEGTADGAAVGGTSGGSGGGRRDARSGGGRSGGGSSGAGATFTAEDAGGGRGVTNTSVKLGFSFFNVGTYGVVPAYDVGPGPEKMMAVQRRWQREGRDTVHGRKIELVYSEFSITDEATQRASCLQLVEDAKVFAVAAAAGMYAGTDCVTKEKRTPLVQTASTGGTAAGVRERAPYFFMVAPDRSQTSRNWAHWAHHRGLLKDKVIGFYYSEEETEELKDNFIAELKNLGYGKQIAVEVTAGDDDEVGPEDSIAVNQFQTNGVNLAILLLNGLRMENFMQQAQTRGYRPEYIASDLGVNTDDTKTTTFLPTQWDGTYAMSSMLYGQRGAPLPREAQICIDDYRAVLAERGEDSNPEPGRADFNYTLMSCHALELAWQALNNAGRTLNTGRYIAAMEAITGYDGAFGPATTFGAGDHTGSNLQRTLQWRASCRCWQRVTDFAPFWLP